MYRLHGDSMLSALLASHHYYCNKYVNEENFSKSTSRTERIRTTTHKKSNSKLAYKRSSDQYYEMQVWST